MKRIAAIVGAVFYMVAVIGCCNTQAARGTPTAYASKYRQSRNTAGDIVYNLGSGTTANSNAVRLSGQQNPAPCGPSRSWLTLCGGAEQKSEPARKWWSCPPPPPVEQKAEPGRRWWNCPPPPPMRPAARPAPAPAQPVVSTVAPAVGGCATGNCDWLVLGSACDPGDGLGACYTLTDEEAMSGPTVYVPNAGSLEALSGLGRIADDIVGGDIQTASAQADVEAALGIEKTVEAPAPVAAGPIFDPVVETAAPAVDRAVEIATPAPAIPAIPETVDTAALRPPETVEVPAKPVEMPPVFRKGATEAAAEEVLSRIGKVESIDALSPVELPPEL